MRYKPKKSYWLFATGWIVLLMIISMSITVLAAVDLTSTVAVSGLTVSSADTTAWTGSTAGASWSGTTTSSGGGCSETTYTPATGELTLTNNSGETKVLTFDYTITLNDGSVAIDGTSVTANSSFTKALSNGASIVIKTESSGSANNTTMVTLSNIKLEVQQVTTTFEPAANGSYTVNGAAITASTSKTAASTTTYALAATASENYVFAGWYVGDTLYSTEQKISAATFATSGTVTAKFVEDPLYAKITIPSDSAYTKAELVTVGSRYYHDSTSKLVADGGFPTNNSAYSKTAASGTKDKIDVQYVPSQRWSDSMDISYSGTAMGDYVDGGAQESYAYARVQSDIIRIYAKENCNVSFDYTGSFSTGGSSATEKNTSATIYYYITTANSASSANVKTGTALTGSGSSGTIALSKGNYLYILAEGYAKNRYMNLMGSNQFTMTFDYSTSISNFSVSYNEKKDILNAGFRDNTGVSLGSGTIKVNDVAYAIGTDGSMAAMEFADLSGVELAVGTTPANYVHIGWAITPEGGDTTYQYTSTYTRTLTENITVNALFVPKTVITMGANGYADATYTDFNGNALNGQYVARNADSTAFYTSLADAFGATDTVVLLAGSTINGDWEIPGGKTFVIPYGMTDKGSTVPVSTASGIGGDYCLVNLNGGLTVNGTLLVSAQQYQGSGAPGGPLGHLSIASGKTVTVNGALYGYGPVTGSGTVNANSAAKIHEFVEFSDNTVVIYIYNIYNERSSKEVFPYNTMFVNTIEVPVTYQTGATLTGHVAIKFDTVSTADVPLIGTSGAMINLSSGTMTKHYDHAGGHFVFRFDSGSVASTGSFSITITATVVGQTKTITMNTGDYYLPLSAPYCFDVAGNLTLNGNYKFLPGAMLDVKSGGTLTVAEGSNVVFYRRNDYDYRGKHANSTEQWGYSERAYPQNPTRFPGVTYPLSFSNSNMGSAKLNVDGALVVNGGLYVTDELQTDTANGITLTANGYNYLTGSGTINMTNAGTNLTSINEVMRAASTNDLAWDTVAVVPMKGLKADAAADDAAQYASLSGVVQGSTNANGLNVWSADPCAAGHTLTLTAEVSATCAVDGTKAYWTCGTCGTSFADEACATEIPDLEAWLSDETGGRIVAAGHTYGDVTYDWTDYTVCTAARVCTVCPEETEGHTETAEAAITSEVTVPATCVAPGVRAYTAAFQVDWAAEQTTTEEIAIDETAHAWDNACDTECNHGCGYAREITHSYGDWEETTAPGCETDGEETKTCSECGDTQTQAVEAAGHNMVAGEPVAATCNEAGYTPYSCSNGCGKTENRDIVSATGCSYSTEWSTDDSSHWHECSVCGEEADRAAHADDSSDHKCDTCEYVMSACSFTVKGELKTAGTCMTEADHWASCSVCGAVSDTVTMPGEKDPNNHTGVNHTENAKPADCTNAGYTGDTVCECGVTVEVGNTIEATGHLNTTTTTVDATCTADGSVTVTCDDCGATISRETIQAAGHSYSSVVTAPTCDADGYTTYTCTCGDRYTGDTVAKLGHDYELTDSKTATCTEDGYETYTCQNDANHTYTNTLDKTDHSYDSAITEPTHTEPGYTTYTCSVCGDSYNADDVAALGHSYTADVTTEPTCTEKGVETYTCTCGTSYTEEIEALGHNMAAAEGKAATCTEDGYTAYTACSRCDHVEGKVVIPAGHTIAQSEAQEKTCTQDGWAAYEYCTECDYTTKVVIPAGHTIAQGEAQEKTCTQDGWAAYEYCTECDYSTKVVIPAGHTIAQGEAQTKTCTQDGWTAYEYCTECDYSTKVVDEATGHVWFDATCTDSKTCSVCGVTEGEALGHSYESVVTAPTCTEDGYTTYTCVCGDTYTADEVEATGHTEGEAVEEKRVEPTATEDGSYESVVYCSVCGTEISRETVVLPAAGGEEIGYTVNFINYTASGENQATIKIGDTEVGYQQKTAVEAILGENGTFIVGCAKACVVAYTTDSGETYTEVYAVVNDDGAYSFTIDEPVENMTIAVVYNGDVDLNGAVNGNDALRIQRYYAGMTTNNAKISVLGHIAANVDGNTTVNGNDALRIQRNYAGMTTNNAKIDWHIKK